MSLSCQLLWPPHAKSWLIGKDSDAGRDWGQEEKGATEDEMAGWHHWLYGREFEWTLGVGDGQGGLACCDSWGRKESDTTERLNPELLLLVYQLSKTAALCLSPIQIVWANWECLLGEMLVKCGYHLNCVPFFKDHNPSSFHLFFLVSSAFRGLRFIFFSRIINIISKMIGLIWTNLPVVQLDSSCFK